MRTFLWQIAVGTFLLGGTVLKAQAPNWYVGNVTWIEVWKAGNVAFKLDVANPPCNGQYGLNKSDPGFKNLYAALIAARFADRPITVYAPSCVPAEGYGGSYASVEYLYP